MVCHNIKGDGRDESAKHFTDAISNMHNIFKGYIIVTEYNYDYGKPKFINDIMHYLRRLEPVFEQISTMNYARHIYVCDDRSRMLMNELRFKSHRTYSRAVEDIIDIVQRESPDRKDSIRLLEEQQKVIQHDFY